MPGRLEIYCQNFIFIQLDAGMGFVQNFASGFFYVLLLHDEHRTSVYCLHQKTSTQTRSLVLVDGKKVLALTRVQTCDISISSWAQNRETMKVRETEKPVDTESDMFVFLFRLHLFNKRPVDSKF